MAGAGLTIVPERAKVSVLIPVVAGLGGAARGVGLCMKHSYGISPVSTEHRLTFHAEKTASSHGPRALCTHLWVDEEDGALLLDNVGYRDVLVVLVLEDEPFGKGLADLEALLGL